MFFIASALFSLFIFPSSGWSQARVETPSQKTSEAVKKFKGAPASVGRDLRALKEAAKAKLGSIGKKGTSKTDKDPLAIPERKNREFEIPSSSVRVRRDPFRPFVLEIRPQRKDSENLSPLERYEVGQLKLVGIVWDIPDPRAMVEDAAGLGYVIKLGTPIGRNDGKVKVIGPKQGVIEEVFLDFYGTRKTREVKLKLVSE